MEVNLIKYLTEKETEMLTRLIVLMSFWELESFGFNYSKINAIAIGKVFETLKLTVPVLSDTSLKTGLVHFGRMAKYIMTYPYTMKSLKMKIQRSHFHTLLQQLCWPTQKSYAAPYITEAVKGNSPGVMQVGHLAQGLCVLLGAVA